MPIKEPCYGCTDRHAHCHSECPKWAARCEQKAAEKHERIVRRDTVPWTAARVRAYNKWLAR